MQFNSTRARPAVANTSISNDSANSQLSVQQKDGLVQLMGESASDLLSFNKMVGARDEDGSDNLQGSFDDNNHNNNNSSSGYYSFYHDSSSSALSPGALKTPRSNQQRSTATSKTTNTRPAIESEIFVLPFEGKCSPIAAAPPLFRDSLSSSSSQPKKLSTKKPSLSPDHHNKSNNNHKNKLLPPPEVFVKKQLPRRTASEMMRPPVATTPTNTTRRTSPMRSQSDGGNPPPNMMRHNLSSPSSKSSSSSSIGCSHPSSSSGSRQRSCCPPAVVSDDNKDNDNKTQKKNHLKWDRQMIQVVPGYSLPLCGAQESIAAYERHAIQETSCNLCQTPLFCIDSCSVVLCPMCRTFSPIESGGGPQEQQLGLGLTVELLQEELQSLRFS